MMISQSQNLHISIEQQGRRVAFHHLHQEIDKEVHIIPLVLAVSTSCLSESS